MQQENERLFITQMKRIFAQNGFSALLTEENAHRFYRLRCELLAFNSHTNLTAITDDDGIILKHFLDSITISPYIPENETVLDVGTGGGFPSLPLAIVRPDLTIMAMDSTAKKLLFATQMANMLSLPKLHTLCARAEEAAHTDLRGQFGVVCARAVAALPVLAEWCLPFVRPGGILIAMKSKGAEEERHAAQRAVHLLGGAFRQQEQLYLFNSVSCPPQQHSVSEHAASFPEGSASDSERAASALAYTAPSSKHTAPNAERAASASASEEKKDVENALERVIFIIEKHAATPRQYPRENRKIKKSPL